MAFKDHWEDYNFREMCDLNAPDFHREKSYNIAEVKRIALHAYEAGVQDEEAINLLCADSAPRNRL